MGDNCEKRRKKMEAWWKVVKKDLDEERERERAANERERDSLKQEVRTLQQSIQELSLKWENWTEREKEVKAKEMGEESDRKEEMARKIDASCQTENEDSTWRYPPKALTEEEWEAEKEERKRRRRNLKVIGVSGDDSEVVNVVGSLAARTQRVAKVEDSWKIDGGLMLKFKSIASKNEIWEMRGKLKNSGLWIEEDWTEREEIIGEWLRREKVRLEGSGMAVKLKYMRAKVGETIWEWNEREGRMMISWIEEKEEITDNKSK